MVNAQVVADAAHKKIADQLLFSIVNEAFTNALPLDTSQFTSEDYRDLQRYTWSVCKSIGGASALESAVDPVNKTPAQNLYLGQIYNVVTEGALVARKKAEKTVSNDPEITFKTALDKVSLSNKDFQAFTKDKEKLSLDKVSEVIKNKTISVIKDEQEQYEKEQKLDKELNDALQPTSSEDEEEDSFDGDTAIDKSNPTPEELEPDSKPDTSDDVADDIEDAANDAPKLPAKEAYLDIFLDKNAPRQHVSVFSRLQDHAMEAMETQMVRNPEDFLPIAMNMTFNTFLKTAEAPNLDSAMEAAHVIAKEEVCMVPQDNRPKLATLISIIVYTMMETLKTMGIFCPTQPQIRRFVMAPVQQGVAMSSAQELYRGAESAVSELKMRDFSKMNNQDLANNLARMKKATEALDSIEGKLPEGVMITPITMEANRYIEDITDILNQREIEQRNALMATESFMVRRQKENDLAQFNRMQSLFGKNPNVRTITLEVQPKGTASVINVVCANEGGSPVNSSYMNMEYACEASKYIDYLKDRFHHSKLGSTDKHVKIHVMDGKGQFIELN